MGGYICIVHAYASNPRCRDGQNFCILPDCCRCHLAVRRLCCWHYRNSSTAANRGRGNCPYEVSVFRCGTDHCLRIFWLGAWPLKNETCKPISFYLQFHIGCSHIKGSTLRSSALNSSVSVCPNRCTRKVHLRRKILLAVFYFLSYPFDGQNDRHCGRYPIKYYRLLYCTCYLYIERVTTILGFHTTSLSSGSRGWLHKTEQPYG